MNYKKEAERMLKTYNMSPAEEELVRNHFQEVIEKFLNMDDRTHDILTDYFTKWICGECPKARLNYWMKKTNTTVEELNIWMTW